METRGGRGPARRGPLRDGRIRSDSRARPATGGRPGQGRVTLRDGAYKVSIRAQPAVEGTFDEPVYDLATVCALVRSGKLPEGKRTLRVPNLPGSQPKERELRVEREEQGQWSMRVSEQWVERRDAKAGLLYRDNPERPFWSREPARAGDATDRSVRGKAPPALRQETRLEATTSAVSQPAGDWRLFQMGGDEGFAGVGLEHPLDVGILALDLPLAFEGDADARRAVVEGMRQQMREKFELGAPEATRFQDRPAFGCKLSGTQGMQAVEGMAYFLADGRGKLVVVMGMYPADLKARCVLMLAGVMRHVQLDAAKSQPAPKAEEPEWVEVESAAAGLTLRVPASWRKPGAGDHWVSKQRLAQLRLAAAELPEGRTADDLHGVWVARLSRLPTLKDLEAGETQETEVDGRTAWITRVEGRLAVEGGKAMHLHAASVGIELEDRRYVEITVTVVSPNWKPEVIDRVIESARWKRE